ncbi:type II toxin-antitoxin system RelE family toxin [Floridanema aerugineum]|uniref:Type II toxin-antitoxin system RelE/ParE family toxin n=1 Tax=Floridaenema aerugineum BLCC-F46 TaxID=3153654 RepID=A0ABV4XC66_9CYAN
MGKVKDICKSDRISTTTKTLQFRYSSKDVKRLTNFTPEYRLRVGDYRVLFEIEDNIILVYRIKHRSDAYS